MARVIKIIINIIIKHPYLYYLIKNISDIM